MFRLQNRNRAQSDKTFTRKPLFLNIKGKVIAAIVRPSSKIEIKLWVEN